MFSKPNGIVLVAVTAAAAAGVLCPLLLSRYMKRGADKEKKGGDHANRKQEKHTIRSVKSIERHPFKKEDLLEYDGVKKDSIYVSVKLVVYEVAPQFYGPGQPYHLYAGREISRSLAKSDLTGKELDKDWAPGTSEEELQQLEQWVAKLKSKYPVVGWYVPEEEFYVI
ncbi:Cytochrome b5-like heme/steroid binding domain [Trypanosoma melophagium]|uniref:Cytochrome b5-like heme/steroid binding domain n=1 Tax=Trypanosoma melophagium TaxID=715481 RepID=UPI00351A5087|nr:Cytochrome b5-like heme/steroid binding domain [Trypanosoma melophagium]